MKIHMRNIVEGAIIRGLSDGYLAVKPTLLSAKTEAEEFHAINSIVDAIWDELDMVIDFTDDDEDDHEPKQPMGFSNRPTQELADAVSTDAVDVEADDEDTDEDAAENARLRMRRMRRYLQRRAR